MTLLVSDIIKKIGPNKYRLYSHTGKNLGTYSSRAAAERRERQVKYFKHKNKDAFFCDAARPTGDPTGTYDIRRRYITMAQIKFRQVRKVLQQAIVKQDVLGLKPETIGVLSLVHSAGERTVAFQRWVDNLLSTVLIERDGAWLRPMIQTSYIRAVKRAIRLTGKMVAPEGSQVAAELAVLATVELQGIAEAVSQRVMRASALAYVERWTPERTFQEMDKALSSVGLNRTKSMINLMVVKAFSTGTLDQFEAAGLQRVGLIPEKIPRVVKDAPRREGPGSRGGTSGRTVQRIRSVQRTLEQSEMVEVATAGDDDVCPICEEIEENNPYTIDEARSLIPAHPNCRCAFVPLEGPE